MNTTDMLAQLETISGGFQRAQILFTAVEADVFALLETPTSAEAVADAAGWHPRGTRMLLDGLVSLDLVLKESGAYRNGELASQCLVPGAPTDQTHILRHKANSWATWSRLPEAVRTGTAPAGPKAERTPEELRAFICGMADLARQSAQAVLNAIDLSTYSNMLDIGTGPGSYAIAFLEAHANTRATLFDMPDVLPIAREEVDKAGLTDRVAFQEGDLTTDTFAPGHDVILVSNIIHSYGPETNQSVIQRCFDALPPNGLIIIKDFILDPQRTAPEFGLLFALHMLLHTEAGDTYTVEDIATWTDTAGFAKGKRIDLGLQSALWVAQKI